VTDAPSLGLLAAFAAGIVSFVSPCVLPLVPAYLSYVGGTAPPADGEPAPSRARAATLLCGATFVLGFGSVFVLLGASATALGHLVARFRYEANIVAGIVVIVFGLLLLGVFRRALWWQRELRPQLRLPGGRPGSAFALGVAFGFGWTPCVGPILGAILTFSALRPSVGEGIALLTAYAAGLGVPFLLSAAFVHEAVERLRVLRRAGRPLQAAAGLVMVLLGVAMVTDTLSAASIWLLDAFPALARIG